MRRFFLNRLKEYTVGLLLMLMVSCAHRPFPDYSQTENGLYFKLIDIGEGDKKATPGDYLTLQMTILSEKDSVLYDTQRMGLEGTITFILEAPQHPNDYREGFQLLAQGDSAQFITDAYTFYLKKNKVPIPNGMNLNSVIKVQVRMMKIDSPLEHQQQVSKIQEQADKGEFEEKKIIENYFKEKALRADTMGNGLYYIPLTKGNHLMISDSSHSALINYQGSFLNGRIFDFLYENQPFEYIMGADNQLLPGLEIGIRHLHEGERGKFIIPSHLAYGSSGSASGMVPPFTTVIYDVELIKVQ
jgi:FKBP-type peptidyl-prolyl cis-trans isomerase FkpA